MFRIVVYFFLNKVNLRRKPSTWKFNYLAFFYFNHKNALIYKLDFSNLSFTMGVAIFKKGLEEWLITRKENAERLNGNRKHNKRRPLVKRKGAELLGLCAMVNGRAALLSAQSTRGTSMRSENVAQHYLSTLSILTLIIWNRARVRFAFH